MHASMHAITLTRAASHGRLPASNHRKLARSRIFVRAEGENSNPDPKGSPGGEKDPGNRKPNLLDELSSNFLKDAKSR